MAGVKATRLPFSCLCGALTGHVTSRGVRLGTHTECFCHDCRAAQLYFGQPDPAPGPVDILQTLPEDIVFENGQANLAVMQLSPNGMLRWYAKCCNAPLATTPKTARFPFVGFIASRLSDTAALGPVTTRGFVPGPDGKQHHERLRFAALGLLGRLIRSWTTGSWKSTPFFDVAGKAPVASPTVLSKEDRSGFYD